MENNVYTVSQVNKYIKMILDKETFLNNITIQGEITNFKAHYTGHFYFTLKDENSTIKCIMFKSFAGLITFKPKDGMKVVITGQIGVFERDGVYQIYCKKMSPAGLGDLYLAYEQLKAKLQAEGLFDETHKKAIPFLPNRVGVITSRTGAVVKDIINVSTRRYDKVNLLIYPAAVQGVNVASTVINGIKLFNKLNNVDVIIIARGGGSFEDLFGFNDEKLAYEIYNSNIPIVSAVGHETDFTICDFVSDLRAPTPSAAAELVYPQYLDIINKIKLNETRIYNATTNYLERRKEYVRRIMAAKLEKVPLDMINNYKMIVDNSLKHIENNVNLKLERYKARCNNAIVKIDTLSPLKTLTRGYSVTQSLDGKVIKSVNDIAENENVNIVLSDGKLVTKVEKKEEYTNG